MKDINKKEVNQKIGSTQQAKERVWQKLNTPKKKYWFPVSVGIAFSIAYLLFVIVKSIQDPPIETISFNQLLQQETGPVNIENNKALYVATNNEQYKNYATLFQVTAPIIDFSKEQAIFIYFLADGCGSVVDYITYQDESLHVQLNLPPNLRGKNVSCTAIGISNTVIATIPKFPITSATIDSEAVTLNTVQEIIHVEPLISGYVTQLTDEEMLISHYNGSIEFERITDFDSIDCHTLRFPRNGSVALGDYVYIYGKQDTEELGVIDEIQIEKQISILDATSVVQQHVNQALQEQEVQKMAIPVIASTFFDQQTRLWEIHVIDEENKANIHMYSYPD